ncbi:MAG TPA: hypothetical protein EYP59_06490 [Thiotrichaceae bacterium]|nr:hypothetical protein [Thiotrichaceae bacterium]
METHSIETQIDNTTLSHETTKLTPPTYGEILRFTIPLVLGLVTSAVNTLIDTLFIGQLGTAQLAAVPLAAVFYFSGWVLIAGILRNSIAFMGRAFGVKDYSKIGVVLAHYQFLEIAQK